MLQRRFPMPDTPPMAQPHNTYNVFSITLPPLSPPTTTTTTLALTTRGTTTTTLSPPGDGDLRLARRRKQCRVSQRRYRDKKGSAEYNLRLDVNGLRESVERLRQTRQLLESRLWSDKLSLYGSIRKAVEQYYIMFSHGLSDASAGGYAQKCYDVQVGFLGAFLDPEVRFGEECGIDNIVSQWRRYSIVHESMWVKTTSAEIFGTRDTPIAVVDGLLGVRMSRATIVMLFPHILGNEWLMQALIGQEVVYDTRTVYTFSDRNQVLSQDLAIDFLSGISKVLHNAEMTSRVVSQALILPSTRIGDVNVDEVEAANAVVYDADDVQGPHEPATSASSCYNSPEPECEDGSSSPFEVLNEDADDVGEVFVVVKPAATPASVATEAAADAAHADAPTKTTSSSRFALEFIMS